MKHFKLYSAIIVSALSILLCYNIYCLVELYQAISRQTVELISQSLKDADLDEVLNRPKKYPVPDSVPDYQGKSMSQKRSIEGDTLMIYVFDGEGEVTEVRKMPLDPGTNYSDIMVDEIGYGAHQTVDPIYPFYIADLDSLFQLSLSRKGIRPKYAFVNKISSDGTVVAGQSPAEIKESLDSVSICYNIMSGERYVAYYSSPQGYVLLQMLGIVLSTGAIIILIATALWYLFRTVSRLRTIEEMKDDFVNNMTHELKTPISIAYSANDALLHYDTANDPAKKETYLTIANKQLKRLGELVENILAMSMERRKTMQLRPETIHLSPFINEIAAAQRMRGEKEITIDVKTSEGTTVYADKTHLANILNNLIDNSIKYSGDSVRITVKCDGNGIAVSDNGIGIPAKSIPFLFNKFYRVPHGNRQDTRGYGIGLYYVKCMAEKMGWTVAVRSSEGKGSIFFIDFCKDER